MPTTKLKAPEGHASFVCDGSKQYNVDPAGFIEVANEHVAAALAHGYLTMEQFQAQTGAVVDVGARRAIDALASNTSKAISHVHEKFSDLHKAVDSADRSALFAHLKGLGVAVSRTTKTDILRDILAAEIGKAEETEKAAEVAEAEAAKKAAETPPAEG